jgi:hypothetical protein
MRHFKGQAFEIVDIAKFLINPSNPDAKSRKPITDGSAEVTIQLQPGLPFLTPPHFDASLDGEGNFDVAVPDHTVPEGPLVKSATLTVSRHEGNFTVLGRKFPLIRTVYRSAAFELSKIDSSGHKVSVFFPKLPDSSGIKQDDVNNELTQAQPKLIQAIQATGHFQFESLSAFINDGYVHVFMQLRGPSFLSSDQWKMKCDLSLTATDSSDLNTFVDAKIDDFQIDRPGLTGLSGMCKSDDDVKREFLQPAVDNLMVKLNAEIKTALLDAIAQKIGKPEKVVEAIFNSQATLTFERLRFPVVNTIGSGMFAIKFRNIVPSPCIGFPRNLG